MKETDAIDEYILQHIDEESDYLKALYRDTHVKLLRPRMASGHLHGRMLKMFVQRGPLFQPFGQAKCGVATVSPDFQHLTGAYHLHKHFQHTSLAGRFALRRQD